MVRFSSVACLAFAILVTPACADERSLTPPPGDAVPGDLPGGQPVPPPGATKPPSLGFDGDRRRAVDELLGRLSSADDPRSAKRIAAAVQALWLRSGSDTVDLLTTRSNEAQRAQKMDMAVKLMDEVVSLKPEFAEGWNRRATLHFAAKEYDAAMADIRETLVREPRHFGAWLGLGRILADSGLEKQALAAFRKTLEIYPAVEGLKKEVDDLALKVEGQPI